MVGKYLRVGIMVGVALTSAPAFADGPASSDEAQRQATARAIGQKGLNLFDARRFQDAWEKLHEADAIYHAPTLTLFMARSLRELGMLVEARLQYEQIIADPMAQGAFAQTRETARAELAALVPRIASVEVVVTGVSYQAAGVRLDGATLPEGRQPVNPGTHTIETAVDVERLVKTLTLVEGESRRIEIVALKHEDRTPVRGPNIPPEPPLRPAIIIGGGVATAVALATGIGLTVWSNSATAERDAFRAGCLGGDNGACNQFDSADQRRWLSGNAAVYSFIGAGAFGIATVTLALVAPRIMRSPKISSTSSRSGVTPAGVGFSW